MAASKTVLCVYSGRKRPIVFEGSSDPTKDRKNLLEAAILDFADILPESSTSSGDYFLQQESSEWGGLIDLSGFVKDRTTVYLCCSEGEVSYCK